MKAKFCYFSKHSGIPMRTYTRYILMKNNKKIFLNAPIIWTYDIASILIFSILWVLGTYDNIIHRSSLEAVVKYSYKKEMSHPLTKPTNWHVRPAKTQISLGIRPVWSESSLSARRKLGSLATHWMHRKDSDQTGLMPRLIWVFAGRTCHFYGFVKRWHKYSKTPSAGLFMQRVKTAVFTRNIGTH